MQHIKKIPQQMNHPTYKKSYQGITQPHRIRVRIPIPDEGLVIDLNFLGDLEFGPSSMRYELKRGLVSKGKLAFFLITQFKSRPKLSEIVINKV